MNTLLRDLTNEIYRLNDYLKEKAFSKEEIVEEEENLERVGEVQEKIRNQLKKMKECPLDDENKFCSEILKLHVLTCNLAWYFDHLNENIEKIIQCYPLSKEFLEKNKLD